MKAPSKPLVVVAAKRTPFGAMLGSLKSVTATDLAVHASRAALTQSGLSPAAVNHVIVGNVMSTSADGIYCARHVGLKAGVPIEVPALTLNRLCGSGFQAAISGAEQLLLDEAEVVLVGGTENMSQSPHVLRGAREGFAFGKAPELEDSLAVGLTDSYCRTSMAMTAENVAADFGITRAECDAYALLSQKRAAAAQEGVAFRNQIVPVDVETRKGTVHVQRDEHPRPASTLEALAKLPPVFKKDGVVTAGNASGICDGAGALVLTTEEVMKREGLTPLARIVGWGMAGVDPTRMGLGPVPAIRNALSRTGLSLHEMSRIEVNEAFAAQYLAVEKELGLPREITNASGGAIALGHPLGASGARILAHLVYDLAESGGRFALGSACIGGGQGIAVILEKPSSSVN